MTSEANYPYPHVVKLAKAFGVSLSKYTPEQREVIKKAVHDLMVEQYIAGSNALHKAMVDTGML